MTTEWTTEAQQLMDGPYSRGAIKRAGVRLDTCPELRAAVVALGKARGISFPTDHAQWPGKKLLRLARGREESARQRTRPVTHDEGFVCVACGFHTPPLGVTSRDHCPRCLTSLHVDVIPGDRASDCGGVLKPVEVAQLHGAWRIGYRCVACGERVWCKAVLDGHEPDDWGALMRVAGRSQS